MIIPNDIDNYFKTCWIVKGHAVCLNSQTKISTLYFCRHSSHHYQKQYAKEKNYPKSSLGMIVYINKFERNRSASAGTLQKEKALR